MITRRLMDDITFDLFYSEGGCMRNTETKKIECDLAHNHF